MTPPAVNVISIVSVSHSGSTLLDILLGSHSRITSLGEVKMLNGPRKEPPSALAGPCSCGAPRVAGCPFWRSVDAELERAARLRLVDLDLESPDPAVSEKHNLALFRAASVASGSLFLVDSSKHASRMERLAAIGGLRIYPIHLRRSVFGVAYSQRRRGRDPFFHAKKWAFSHYAIGQALRGRDHLRVRYEDLVTRPRVELGRVADWLGLQFEPEQLAWGGSEVHLVWGNRMRLARTGELRLDDAWRSGFTLRQKLILGLISARRVVPGPRAFLRQVLRAVGHRGPR